MELVIDRVSKQYKNKIAVDRISLTLTKGIYGLLGANGAGKTTVFNLLTGVYKPDDGKVELDGKNITGAKTIDINKAGIARTFQNIRLFKELSVLDNVKVGLHNQYHYSTIEGILRLPRYFKVEKEMNEKAMELLKVLLMLPCKVENLCPKNPDNTQNPAASTRIWHDILPLTHLIHHR